MPKKELSGDVQYIYKQYKSYRDFWENFFERGRESFKFYGGDQWDAEEIAEFQTRKRPIVTINVLGSMVRQVTGLRTKERIQPMVRPERDGTVDMARVYTKLLYFILKSNDYHLINHDVQEDQVVCGRGWWEIFMDNEDNELGELKLRHAEWNEVIPDFMAQDLWYRDARALFRSKWVPKEVLKEEYGLEDINTAVPQVTWRDDNGRIVRDAMKEFDDDNGNLLVIEKWSLKKVKKTMLTDGATFKEIGRRMPEDGIRAVFGENFAQVDRNVKELWVETIIPAYDGDNVIKKVPADIQIGTYTFVPAVCYKAAEKIMGIIEDLKDEQRRTNKAFSQIVEILGFSAKGLWLIKEGSVDEKQFDMNAARPGGKVSYTGDVPPQHIQTGMLPSGYAQIFEVSKENLQRISGIVPALEGRSEFAGESGIKFAQKLNQAREQLAVIDRRYMDAFSYVCKLMLKALPQVYDYPFAIQVLEGQDSVVDLKINQETLMGMMNDVANDPGEYDVNIQQTQETSTIRQAQLGELATMMSQIGPQFASLFAKEWILGSDIEGKNELAEKLEVMSGQALQEQQMRMQIAAMNAAQGQQQASAKQQMEQQELAIKDRDSKVNAASKTQQMALDRQKTEVDSLETLANMVGGGA